MSDWGLAVRSDGRDLRAPERFDTPVEALLYLAALGADAPEVIELADEWGECILLGDLETGSKIEIVELQSAA